MRDNTSLLYPKNQRSVRGKEFLVLTALLLLATPAAIPYLAEFIAVSDTSTVLEQSGSVLVLSALCDRLLPSLIAIGIGLWLGEKVGLGAPVLRAWLVGDPDANRRFRLLLLPAIVAGGLASVVVIILSPLGLILAPGLANSAAAAEAAQITPRKGALVAFSAGVIEELQFRLGLMTLIVWLGTCVTRCHPPGSRLMWMANVLAALLFGLLHLGNAIVLSVPITIGAVVYVLTLNGVVGLLFGWLYWRQGLLAAMLAHISTDIVLKVIIPLLTILSF